MNSARLAAIGGILSLLIWSIQSNVVSDTPNPQETPKHPPKLPRPLIRPRHEADPKSFVNARSHDGEELAADLPGEFHHKNIGSRIDGAGMCVFTSIEHAATWHGIDSFIGFRDWCASKYPGGGYPSKVDKLIKAYCDAKKIPIPPYKQWEGKDPDDLLSRIDTSGRMACVTYGYSPRYHGRISHMVNCCKFGGKYAVVLDNNFPGEDKYEWMTESELVQRMKSGSNSAWIFVWLDPAPPPMPK